MLTARHVVTAVLAIAALTIVAMGISLWRSLEPSPLGADSYGTRAHGQRGAFELLSDLQVPVERSLLPPDGNWQRPTTLVLWQPHESLIQMEPAYLARVAEWVRAGGRLVVALPRDDSDDIFSPKSLRPSQHEVSLFKELGLPKVRTAVVDLNDPDDSQAGNAAGGNSAPPAAGKSNRRRKTQRGQSVFSLRDSDVEQLPVACGGQLEDWGGAVRSLEMPSADLQVIDTSEEKPAGWLTISIGEDDEETKTLVAQYCVGQGEILLVGDGALLENRLLGQADNAPLAWRLLVVPGHTVLWDEFYHGLTIRGNPLYLLRREPFGALMAAMLLLIAVCIWRQAARLGPAVVVPARSRRTLAEYVDTMARLFGRSRSSQRFLLSEIRSGTLWSLRAELGLKLGEEKLTTIVAMLHRKHPQRAAELVDAVHAIDSTLAAERVLTAKETVSTLQRISACL